MYTKGIKMIIDYYEHDSKASVDRLAYGDMMLVSLRLVLGCFCIVSSWPSKVLRYCIC